LNTVNKIRTALRVKGINAGNDLRGLLGLNNSFFKEASGARVLVYHGVCETDPTRFNSLFLSLKTFESHLQFFKQHFHVISLDEFYAGNFNSKRLNLCLTFDDGFANNYKYVLPLLEKYKLPASFFITAIREAGYDILWNDFLAIAQKYGPLQWEFMNDRFKKDKHNSYVSQSSGKMLKGILRGRRFEDKAAMMRVLGSLIDIRRNASETDHWLQMTFDEIRQLSLSPLATVGCHGYYHNDLAVLEEKDIRDELVRAKNFLEHLIQKPVDALAFPYGSYSRATITESRKAGFSRLLAADFLFPEDRNDNGMRERFTVSPYISVNNQMMAIIHGKYPR